MNTINSSYYTYCDHYHQYSFYYDTVTPASSTDSTADLSVMGWSMIGFPGACSYSDGLAIGSTITSDTVWATTGDQFAWTCGYYVTYEWQGYDNVYFELHTNNAMKAFISALSLTILSSIYL
jgi:hypothetical protein